MKSILAILVFLSVSLGFDDNSSLLNTIFNSDGWSEVSRKSDSLVVYKKSINGIKIPVFKATMITSVPIEGVMDAILDGDNAHKFLKNSHLKESQILNHTIGDTTFLYQILDLPIISDRHYITKNYTDTISVGAHYRLNWLIDSKQNEEFFKDFITRKEKEHEYAIFIMDGVGSWELKRLNYNQSEVTYYVLIDPGGMIPDYLVTYANRALGPNTVMSMVKEGEKRVKNIKMNSSILFCIKKETPKLLFKKISSGPVLIINNSELQWFAMNYNITALEEWMPTAAENDCDGDVCLDRIYRIVFEHNGRFDSEEVIMKLKNLSSVLYAEEDAARNIFNKSKSKW